MSDFPLGRREPSSFEHVERYPVLPLFAANQLQGPPPNSEKALGLPWWWKDHDQGQEGSCVGFGCSAMMSITNRYQRLNATGKDMTYRYSAPWLYNQAQLVDEWDDTPPEEGTSVKAACDVLRLQGHRRIQPGGVSEPNLIAGIKEVRWATTVDEIRGAIYNGLAVAIGVVWYSSFDKPALVDGIRWIGKGTNLGWVRGGHCVCLFRYSDKLEGFRFMNSWGAAYPATWITYDAMQRLIDEYGEAALITDA